MLLLNHFAFILLFSIVTFNHSSDLLASISNMSISQLSLFGYMLGHKFRIIDRMQAQGTGSNKIYFGVDIRVFYSWSMFYGQEAVY